MNKPKEFMDTEMVSALQCGLRMLDRTAGGYTKEQKYAAWEKLDSISPILPGDQAEMQRLLTAELAKPEQP